MGKNLTSLSVKSIE